MQRMVLMAVFNKLHVLNLHVKTNIRAQSVEHMPMKNQKNSTIFGWSMVMNCKNLSDGYH